ncbi:MAG: RrF2 family transcriptional regulator [candidate division WOR-3 bacterium]
MVKFTLKTEYALKSLIHIASSNEPTSSTQIYEAEGIPMAFLEQILVRLRRKGLIKSLRGKRGGYVLAKPAKDISLLDVINAIEGPYGVVKCLVPGEEMECIFFLTDCVLRDVWNTVQLKIISILGEITLEEIIQRYNFSKFVKTPKGNLMR